MKTYAVTGAASGIGAATTALLRDQGHTVITVDRVDADVVCDLSTPVGRREAAEQISAQAPVLHGIVCCAGIAGRTGVDSELLVSVNYFGAVDLVKALHEQLAAAEGASVVFLSSNSTTCMPAWPAFLARALETGEEPKARAVAKKVSSVAAYPASKAALSWWARREGVKPEWAGRGIRLNSVAPGLIETAMTVEVKADPVFGKFAESYPTALNRPGKPEEVANLISFLLSEESSLLVGTCVFVDGGTDAIKHPRWPNSLINNRAAATVTNFAMEMMTKRALAKQSSRQS